MSESKDTGRENGPHGDVTDWTDEHLADHIGDVVDDLRAAERDVRDGLQSGETLTPADVGRLVSAAERLVGRLGQEAYRRCPEGPMGPCGVPVCPECKRHAAVPDEALRGRLNPSEQCTHCGLPWSEPDRYGCEAGREGDGESGRESGVRVDGGSGVL